MGDYLCVCKYTGRCDPGTLRIPPERIYNGDYTQARNCTIQKMLRMVGFGDNIGSGFQKIMKAWRSLGYANPEIHEEDEVIEVWLTLPLPKSYDRNVGEDVGNISERNITHRQGEIIKIIKVSPSASAKQMSVTLSVTSRTIERDIASLKTLGILIRKGADNDGEWIIRR